MKNETTKQRILTEAVILFSKEGYEAVSVDQIAKAVGIKAPSLYKHYKNKRDIFDSILRIMEQRDAENAIACSLPGETVEAVPEAYQQAQPWRKSGRSPTEFFGSWLPSRRSSSRCWTSPRLCSTT